MKGPWVNQPLIELICGLTAVTEGLLGVIHYLAVEQESFTLIIHGSSFTSIGLQDLC
jgi:hypothetical protein